MKEAEIRPADLFQEYLKLSAKDAKVYFEPSNRQSIPCPACGSALFLKAFNKFGFDYVECTECATLYQSPRPPLAEFEKFYNDSPSSNYWANIFFPAVAEVRRSKIFVPRVEQISSLCAENNFSPNDLIDIGGGYGTFLTLWREKYPKTNVYTVEPGAALAEVCRKKGIEVLETVAEHAIKTWAEKADLLTCFEVIEHVHNPFIFITALHQLIKPGGYALVSGLGVEGFDIQVLWENSKSISPPHHINFMSVDGFELLFKRAGFTDIKVMTPGKLDVDIVLNMIKENPSLQMSRFERTLLQRGEKSRYEFQAFLAKHCLSSHCWIWAKKHEGAASA